MNKRFMSLALVVALVLLATAGSVFAEDEPAPYAFTVNGAVPAILGVSAEGYVGIFSNTTDATIADVEFKMSVDGPTFVLAAYSMNVDGELVDLLNTVESRAEEELTGFSQQRTFDVPSLVWVGVKFNIGGSAGDSSAEVCIESGSYTTTAGLQLRQSLDASSPVTTTIPFGTTLVVTDGGCGRVMVTYMGNVGSVDTRWLVIDNGNGNTGGNGGGGGFVCTTPFEWPTAYPIELGLGGSNTWGNNDYAIIQWYRPSITDTNDERHAGAFLARNSVDLASDVSGSAWVLPNATQAQAQCLLSQDNVALEFGSDAP